MTEGSTTDTLSSGVAVIGLAGRFPGAEDIDAFWQNLLAARETISTFRPEELAPGEPIDDPDYVPRRGVLAQAEWLDAEFFGLSKIEAEITDPQQRVFLESAWTALEHAGYDPRRLPGLCGVWAGTGNNHYYHRQLAPHAELLEAAGPEAVMIGNEKDYIATRVAYRLNLRGPAVNVVTACSTSLVAVAQAVHALMTHQCDMALAGGASVRWPQERGYRHEEGGIFSPDGHCRAFDAQSAGTVFSSGVGCVVLKRVEDAQRDGDTIYAVLRSAALNNDGASKVSFTAPGVEGQSENVIMALALADVPAASIGYVEAHGTGTALGDVIEVTALTQAFRALGDERVQECGLGSLKPSTGHMDAAAGVGGLIKTVLALHRGVLPPTLHFQRPNPRLSLEESPFRVVDRPLTWPARPDTAPRRALVAALGVGGTNAHVVVEEAPPVPARPQPEPEPQLLLLSARTATALEKAKENLARFLEAHADVSLPDVAFTLAQGRTSFSHRAVFSVTFVDEAVAQLRSAVPMGETLPVPMGLPVALMFPGQGSQHAGMGRELAEKLPLVKETFARCVEVLGFDPLAGTDEELQRTSRAQPTLFCLSYALAQQYLAWRVVPVALLGHSIGEYVAATLAGVFSLEDALRIVAARGQLMEAQPAGAMLAVRAPESELNLPDELDLAAVNASGLCVVSGPNEAIATYAAVCTERGVGVRPLHTSHAFHSRMMEGALDAFREVVASVTLQPPQLPVISNVYGRELTAEEATSPDYWARHLRSTVRFADGVTALKDRCVLLEVGPSRALTSIAKQSGARAVASLPSAKEAGRGEVPSARAALGQAWVLGAEISWDGLYPLDRTFRRVALPTYPFERKRYCPELPSGAGSAHTHSTAVPKPAEAVAEPSPAPEVVTEPEVEPAPLPIISRRERLLHELQQQLLKISGIDVSAQPPSTHFLDLGFDSLFLTQAGMALKKHFGVKITFRQLMEELTSLEALAAYLDEQLPPDKFALLAPAPHLVSVAPSTTSSAPPMETNASLLDRLSRIELALGRLAGLPETPNAAAVEPSQPRFTVKVREQKGSEGQKISFGPFRPVAKMEDGSLTPAQRAHLEALIAAYCAKYAKSKAYTAAHRAHFADPRAVAGFNPLWKEMVFPVIADRSEGPFLWDIDGHQWVDVVHGFGSGFFGHRPAFVVEALKTQLDRGFEIGPTHPLAGEVAKLICEFSGQDRAAFSNTGSESLMAAIRVARTVTGRDKIVMFAGAYHGIFDEVLARPLVVNGELRAIPVAPGVPETAQAHLLVLEYGHPESLEIIRRHAHEIAAVLVEPVPSRRPDIAPVAFVQELRRLTADSGTALIFDEVVLGWRTAPEGAQKLFGIRADLVAYGKVVGGGMPLGVLAGQRRFMDALDGGQWQYGDASAPEVGVTFFAGTFIRHPLTLAACKAVLDKLKAEGSALQRAVEEKTARLTARLNDLFTTTGVPIKVTRYSSLWMLNADPGLKYFSLLFYHLRLRGVHIWEGRGNFLSTAHTPQEEEALVAAFADSVRALQEGGFFPSGAQPGLASPSATVAPPALPPQAPSAAVETPFSIAPTTPPRVGPPPLPVVLSAPKVAEPVLLPLTPEQEELYLSAQLQPAYSIAAHESITLRLRGALDEARLQQALATLAARHDALRVRFVKDDQGRVFQAVEPTVAVPFARQAVAGADEAAWDALLTAEFNTPFDLTRAPLWRAWLAWRGPDDYALVLTAHHLICDGWSFGVLARDLAALYRGETLPPAPRLREVVEAPRDPAAVAYWEGEYATPPVVMALPTDRPRASSPVLEAGSLSGAFDPAIVQALRTFCRREKLTLNAVLLSVWQMLLHRLSGAEDIIVGTPMAGQLGSGPEEAVAHQVHFLPLRVSAKGDEGSALSVSAWLAQTRRKLADASDHQDFTLGQLYQRISMPRAAGQPSLVSNTFTFETAGGPTDWGTLEAVLDANAKRKLAFELALFVVQDGEALRWQLGYQQALFNQSTVASWMESFSCLLQAVLTDGAGRLPVSYLPLHSSLALARLSGSATAFPADRGVIHELFAAQAARTPEATALVWEGGSWTYAELEQRANRLARNLVAAGVCPGQWVPLLVERSPLLIAALLGILKTGAGYAPLDPGYPDERLVWLLKDLEASVAVCTAESRERLEHVSSGAGLMIFEINPLTPPAGEKLTAPAVAVAPESPAYLLYTSGSTGQPKGVVVPHEAVVRLVRGQSFARMTEKETWLQLAPTTFDASTLEIWAPLLNGGRLALPRAGALGLSEIGVVLKQFKVTSLWLTAGLFQLMVEERLDDLAPVRELLTGGDVVSPMHARRVLERFPSLRLINGYGPTENTTFTCCYPIALEDTARGALPIGRALVGTSVFVLDERDAPCAAGVAGDLYTGGAGLALGYWRQPEQTASAFLQHPTFGRLYRTGDRARWRADGVVEFLGRADNQIKVRGFRIEPGEIEAVLTEHAEIKQAAVFTLGDSAGDRRLAAAIVPEGKTALPSAVPRDQLRHRLPDYMMPAVFVQVANALPLTANGKIDVRALRQLALVRGQDTSSIPEVGKAESALRTVASAKRAPRSETETKVYELMQEVLGRNSFGIDDDFFALGGDSLRGLQLFTRLEREFSRSLPLGVLFEAPTVAGLAARLQAADTGLPPHVVPIQARGTQRPLFLVHGGDGGVLIYRKLLGELGPDQPVYGIEAPMLTDSSVLAPKPSVAEVAAEYVEWVRRIQPDGPFRLGGYSFGGLVALEMARRLQAQGDEIEHLLIFDTDNPAVPPRYFSPFARVKARWRIDAQDGLNVAERWKSLAARVRDGKRAAKRRTVEVQTVLADRRAGRRSDETLRPVEIREAHMELMQAYRPEPWAGPFTLFRCVGLNDKFEHHRALGWEGVATAVRIVEVPGVHLELFDVPAYAGVLARKVSQVLLGIEPEGEATPSPSEEASSAAVGAGPS